MLPKTEFFAVNALLIRISSLIISKHTKFLFSVQYTSAIQMIIYRLMALKGKKNHRRLSGTGVCDFLK